MANFSLDPRTSEEMLPKPVFGASAPAARKPTISLNPSGPGPMLPKPQFNRSLATPRPAPVAAPAPAVPTPGAVATQQPAAVIDPNKQTAMAKVGMSKAGRAGARAEREYGRTTPGGQGGIGATAGGTGLTPDDAWRKWFPTPGATPANEAGISQAARTAARAGQMPAPQNPAGGLALAPPVTAPAPPVKSPAVLPTLKDPNQAMEQEFDRTKYSPTNPAPTAKTPVVSPVGPDDAEDEKKKKDVASPIDVSDT